MRCERCHGEGLIKVERAIEHTRYPFAAEGIEMVRYMDKEPCPDCGGTGIGHCCDGLVACGVDD